MQQKQKLVQFKHNKEKKRSVWLIYLVSSEISNNTIIHSPLSCRNWQRISKLICNISGRCLGLLKKKVFWINNSDVIISFHDVTNRVLSRDSKYIVDVVMSPKFCNSSISRKEVFITSILYIIWPEKPFFLMGAPVSELLGASEVNSSLLSIQGQSNVYKDLFEDLVIKSKLSPHNGSAALSQLNSVHEKGP